MSALTDSLVNTGNIPPVNSSTLNGGSFSTPSNSDGINLNELENEALNDTPYNNAASVPLANAQSALQTTLGQLAGAASSLLGTNNSLASTLGQITGASLGNSSTSSSFWTDIFLRGVIIILGFIFVAVALTMFGSKAATVIVNETKRSF